MSHYSPGTLVKCRGREWVVLPSRDKELVLLRPLGGSETETCGIDLPLESPPEPDPGGYVAIAVFDDRGEIILKSPLNLE